MNKFNSEKIIFEDFDCLGTSTEIETTCLSCGFTEKVPDFIYDEMSRKKYHFKIRKKVSTLACQKCFKETAISSYWLNNR